VDTLQEDAVYFSFDKSKHAKSMTSCNEQMVTEDMNTIVGASATG